MTLKDDMTLEELKRKVIGLKKLGRIRTTVKGSTGVGDTFEGLLGLPRTNISLPDWGPIELKSHRKSSGSKMTLISIKPEILEGKTNSDLIREYGIKSSTPGRLSFYNTISGRRKNSRGWQIVCDQKNDLLLIQNDEKTIAVANLSELFDRLLKKAKNLILVKARSIKESGTEFFEYYSATLYLDMQIERIPDLIQTGQFVYEWRMHLKPNGSVRDHGPGYRISPKDIFELYNKSELLF